MPINSWKRPFNGGILQLQQCLTDTNCFQSTDLFSFENNYLRNRCRKL